MSVSELAETLAGLPDGALVPAAWVREQLSGRDTLTDLTVKETAELLGRAPSTIRSWAASGILRGAYRLRGREWRIPRAALTQIGQDPNCANVRVSGEANLRAWRDAESPRKLKSRAGQSETTKPTEPTNRTK